MVEVPMVTPKFKPIHVNIGPAIMRKVEPKVDVIITGVVKSEKDADKVLSDIADVLEKEIREPTNYNASIDRQGQSFVAKVSFRKDIGWFLNNRWKINKVIGAVGDKNQNAYIDGEVKLDGPCFQNWIYSVRYNRGNLVTERDKSVFIVNNRGRLEEILSAVGKLASEYKSSIDESDDRKLETLLNRLRSCST